MGLRSGDTLYVVSLDRLSRNKQDITKEVKWFKDNGIDLKILELPTTMVDFPEEEQERLTIRKRQRAGIDAAKIKGKHLGRPILIKPANYDEVIKMWKNKEITAIEAMKRLGVKKSTFYRWVKGNH